MRARGTKIAPFGPAGLQAVLLALALGVGLPLVSACSASSQTAGEQAGKAQEAEGQDAEQATEAQDAAADAEAQAEDEAVVWPDEYFDRRGDVSVLALCELSGKELTQFLEEEDYVWSSRDQMWLKEDGSAALVACGPKGSYLDKEQIAELDPAWQEANATYRLVTSGYRNPRKAFEGVAGKIMTSLDVENTDLGTVGVVQGTEPDARLLVVATKGEGAMVVSVFGEQAIAEGRLELLADRELGSTIDEAFEALVGRPVKLEE